MMYHLKFSLTGGASCSAEESPWRFCSSGFCSSAAMAVPFSRIVCFFLPALLEICLVVLGHMAQHVLDRPANGVVHHPEIGGEDEDGNEDHHRRRLNFCARRGDHLAHLAAHVLEELDEASWLRLQLLQTGAGLFGYCYRLGHKAASILVLLR